MPTVKEVLSDPKFQELPEEAQLGVLQKIDPKFAELPQQGQREALSQLAGMTTQEPEKPSLAGQLGRSALDLLEAAPVAQAGVAGVEKVPEWGRENPTAYGILGAAREATGPLLEAAGLVGGGLLGAAATPQVAGAGAIPGAGGGFAIARNINRRIDELLGKQPIDTGLTSAAKSAVDDLVSGMTMEGAGRVLPAAIVQTRHAARSAIQAGEAKYSLIAKSAAAIRQSWKTVKEAPGNIIDEVIGAATGRSPNIVKEWFRGSEAFRQARSGKVSSEQIARMSKDAFSKWLERSDVKYQKLLKDLYAETGVTIDSSSTRKLAKELIQDPSFNVKLGAEGLQFQGSIFETSKPAQSTLKRVIKTVDDWKDWTPAGADRLRKNVGNLIGGGLKQKPSDAAVGKIYGMIRDKIEIAYPGYSAHLKEYKVAQAFKEQAEKAIVGGEKAILDDVVKKLQSTMAKGGASKLEMLKQLEEVSGRDLRGMIAGLASRSWMRDGAMAAVAGTGVVSGGLTMMTGNAVFGSIPFALAVGGSPRFLSYLAQAAGFTKRQIAAMLDNVNTFRPALIRAMAARKALMINEPTIGKEEKRRER